MGQGFVAIATFVGILFCSTSFANTSQSEASDQAIGEFEDIVSMFFEHQKNDLTKKTQQYDEQATKVLDSDAERYQSAIYDPYYGYQMFILVDKSVSSQSSKERSGSVRQAQTMYIYRRNSDHSLQLVTALPVSTGREPSANTSDTREGFTRVQSATKEYTSRKFGEAMPFSLWFESEYGTAIHQTTQARCDSKIGMRASAGCIRLCAGDSEEVFRLATSFSRKSPIVLLNKRTGAPARYGKIGMDAMKSSGKIIQAPYVIEGYPVFVRIIDGNNDAKVQEIQSIIDNPSQGFRRYFAPVDEAAVKNANLL